MREHATFLGLLLVAVLLCTARPPRQVSAQGGSSIQLEPVLTGLSSPLLVTHARDGTNRLFFVEQTGLIKVLQRGSTVPTTFLDITTKRSCCGERGLLGLAFHPQFTTNRRFFIYYTRTGDGATVISEYEASPSDPNVALTAEKVVLVVAQPFSNHNGGMIEFGPDGFLYIGKGDGGSANDPDNRGQNRNDLLGKILRINIDQPDGQVPYSSPSTNPYFGPTAGRDEIYAIGLRNPWRFSFDRLTGQLWVGDVGQGQREEVDIVTLGGNYGWRVYEGTRCTNLDPTLCNPSNFAAPIFEYTHSGGRCSLTGGYVYRGQRSSLPYGSYIYADYCTGEIFLFQNGSQSLLLDTTLGISSFGEDEAGEIYVCGLGGGVYRIINPNARAAVSVSAASYAGVNLASGSIGAAFGTALAISTAAATELPLPTTLAGTQVTIRDVTGVDQSAPLFFVSPGQVNYLVPETTPVGRAEVRVINAQGQVSTGTIQIVSVAPGIFTANADGTGVPAAYITRARGEIVEPIEPVAEFRAEEKRFVPRIIDLGPPGDEVVLSLFGTGMRMRSAQSAVSIRIGGEPQQVSFAGAQGSFAGLDQINVRLSRTLIGRGELQVEIIVDGIAANPVVIRIQ